LFVKILGYTLHPEPNYNLITEQKNEKDARKADGAILVNSNVVGVIELNSSGVVTIIGFILHLFLVIKSANIKWRFNENG